MIKNRMSKEDTGTNTYLIIATIITTVVGLIVKGAVEAFQSYRVKKAVVTHSRHIEQEQNGLI
jgi:undecaprenyl pyrophosphate phosphatase UppP